MSKVIIIGSGLGGLAAACTLAARGYGVTVFEKNDWTGGKAGILEDKGFRFDTGPTLLTSPSVLQIVFQEAGERLDDYLELLRIDPQWRAFFADRSVLDLCEKTADMKENLREFTRVVEDIDSYERFLMEAQALHEISRDYFYWRPVGSAADLVDPKTLLRLNTLKNLMALRPHQSISECVRSYIQDERTAQMLEHFAQHLGSSPENSPAMLCGLAHTQTQEGVWYPIGGVRAVPEAMRRLAERLEVQFVTGTEITTIKRNDSNQVVGVVDRSGVYHPAGAVISNMDVVRTHRDLLNGSPMAQFEARREYEPSCSGVVFYLGLKKRYDQLSHHNFVFSADPHEEFQSIYQRGEPARDPSAYLAAPAITEPGVAPKGGEALYVLVHTPYLRPHHNWSKLLPKYRKVVFDKLARTAGMDDLEERIVTEHVLTPEDIQRRYNVFNGAIYGLASHGKLHGPFKPINRSPDVEGLYFAGGSAHPGPGIPRAVMSGWIAADALDRDGIVVREAMRLER